MSHDNVVTINEDLAKTIIGHNIQKTRESKKISRQKLGEMVKLSVSEVRKIELGMSFPPVSKLIKIAIVLNTTCDYLMTNDCEICYLDTIITKINKEISDIKPRSF